jgi:hypothetical protein
MDKISVDRAQNAMQQRVTQHDLALRLTAHALNVRSDRPVYSEDGEFLGHWQDKAWIERLRSIARDLADIQRDSWVQAGVEFIGFGEE